MQTQQIIDITNSLIYATTELAMPLLVTALVVGLIVSIFQAATQINEATLTFLPKIAAIFGVLILISPWMIRRMSTYTKSLYEKIPLVVRER